MLGLLFDLLLAAVLTVLIKFVITPACGYRITWRLAAVIAATALFAL